MFFTLGDYGQRGARSDCQGICMLALGEAMAMCVALSLARKGFVRTKIEWTTITIREVSEMSYYPSTNSVVGKVARKIAKRKYKSKRWRTIQYCSRNNARTPMKSDLLVSPNLGSYPLMQPSAAQRASQPDEQQLYLPSHRRRRQTDPSSHPHKINYRHLPTPSP